MLKDAATLKNVKRGIYEIADFHNVAGAVDGTHVRINFSLEDEHIFVHLKNFHLIYLQGEPKFFFFYYSLTMARVKPRLFHCVEFNCVWTIRESNNIRRMVTWR